MKQPQQLRSLILFTLSIGIISNCYGQQSYTKAQVMEILQAASAKLSKLNTVSYKFTREILYKDENYHHVNSAQMFMDLDSPKNIAGLSFQADDDLHFACYNGSQYFLLDKANKTISIQKKPAMEFFESCSSLYNSLISLRTILPWLIDNASIVKTIRDTTIDKRNFYSIQFELYDQFFGNLGKVENFTSAYTGDKNKPYEIIIGKDNFLPYQYITKFKDRKADHITVIYSDIDIRPKAPEELSWFYSTYTNAYKAPKLKQPLVSLGVNLKDWTLPLYSPDRIDSGTLSQYRGKIVLLDFWIKSCGPCLASFPHLNELQQKFGADKFQLLSINAEDAKEDIGIFYKKHAPAYTMLFGGEALAEKYGISFYPTVILLDRSGKTIYVDGFDRVAIEKLIRQHL